MRRTVLFPVAALVAALVGAGCDNVAFSSGGMSASGTGGVGTSAGAGDLATPRAAHTATLLPGGKVLIAGGYAALHGNFPSANAIADTAELYDPGARASAPLSGRMAVPRAHHRATALPTGEVLITGGETRSGVLAIEPEIYNPTTRTFSLLPRAAFGTPPLLRLGHTATLAGPATMASYEVLIVGGLDAVGAAVATPERFSGTATVLPPLVRWEALGGALSFDGHRAVRLASGNVLVSGGTLGPVANPGFLRVTELRPDGAVVRTRVSWESDRRDPAAVLLASGKVLIAGGAPLSGPGAFGDALVYDPAGGGVFAVAGPLVGGARSAAAAVLLANGRVLVAGGFDGGSAPVRSAELFDETGNVFAATGALRNARALHEATRLADGRVLITGGISVPLAQQAGSTLASVEIYAP